MAKASSRRPSPERFLAGGSGLILLAAFGTLFFLLGERVHWYGETDFRWLVLAITGLGFAQGALLLSLGVGARLERGRRERDRRVHPAERPSADEN